MSNISKMTIGDLMEFQRGYDLPKSDFVKGNIPVISSNGILGYHNEFKVKGPGITIGRSGTVGLPHYIENDFFPHNTALFIKDFKGNDPKYIYYLLKTLGLNDRKSGSGVPTMNRNHLHPLSILAHTNIIHQQKIASVLSSLDSKIELNNCINAELESMAKTLYDYWFVQFDFPNEKGKPYKTSGGKMVWNVELKREIPAGWGVISLSKITMKNSIKCDVSEYEKLDGIDLSVMQSNIISINYRSTPGSFKTNLFKMNKFDILFGAIRPYLRKAGIAPFDGVVNGTIHSYSPLRKSDYSFLLCSLTNETIFKYAISRSKGTKMPVIGSDDLLDFKLPYKKEVSNLFEDKVNSLWTKLVTNIHENQKLSELRDWLLPMLMNGQVRVG